VLRENSVNMSCAESGLSVEIIFNDMMGLSQHILPADEWYRKDMQIYPLMPAIINNPDSGL
jgi:hypothetical protein